MAIYSSHMISMNRVEENMMNLIEIQDAASSLFAVAICLANSSHMSKSNGR